MLCNVVRMELSEKANLAGLHCHIVMDAGKTEVARGSKTVLAILGEVTKVDSITGQLKLLH